MTRRYSQWSRGTHERVNREPPGDPKSGESEATKKHCSANRRLCTVWPKAKETRARPGKSRMINERENRETGRKRESRKRPRGSSRSRGSYRILRGNKSKSHASTHEKENLRGHYDETSPCSSASRRRWSHAGVITKFSCHACLSRCRGEIGQFRDLYWQGGQAKQETIT